MSKPGAQPRSRRRHGAWPALWRAAALAALAGGQGGCAGPTLAPGATPDEVQRQFGQPTARYPLPAGGVRLEFARGPYGLQTWMVDLDPAGRVARWAQVLDDAHFAQVVDGMTRDELLRLLGTPAHRAGEWQRRETWSWRYQNPFCLWLRVTLSAEGRVVGGAGTLPDPACEPREGRLR